jgi:hypothetical protein
MGRHHRPDGDPAALLERPGLIAPPAAREPVDAAPMTEQARAEARRLLDRAAGRPAEQTDR